VFRTWARQRRHRKLQLGGQCQRRSEWGGRRALADRVVGAEFAIAVEYSGKGRAWSEPDESGGAKAPAQRIGPAEIRADGLKRPIGSTL
jgi:hypothetical protein